MDLIEFLVIEKLEALTDKTYVAMNGVKLYVSYHRIDDPMVMVSKAHDFSTEELKEAMLELLRQ